MEIILSAAVSVDGFLDDAHPKRLRLSSNEDWAAVKELRRGCDAILVGGETVRKDNPSLGEVPLRVVVSGSGNIPSDARIFEAAGEVLVLSERDFTAAEIVAELEKRGVRRLMVEGGARMLEMFIREGVFDRLRLAVAPLLVGSGVRFPAVEASRMMLEKAEKLGDTAIMWYRDFLSRAIEISAQSPPVAGSYRVGAVVVTETGEIFEGYTHETNPKDHAEEEAIKKALAAGVNLRGATIYASMEPCSTRASKPVSCSELIMTHGFKKVVYALSEPPLFAVCTGAESMLKAGIEVVHRQWMAGRVREINNHLL